MNRINALRQLAFKENKFDFFLISNSSNLTYFTGVSGATSLLVPKQGESVLYVSAVNYEQTKTETSGLEVDLLKHGENLMDKIGKHTVQCKQTNIAVDSLPIESWLALAKAVGGEEKLQPANNLIRKLRKVKDPQEIQLIREACKLANIGMKIASETVRPGIKEKQVAAEIEYGMRKAGSDGTAFETIVASGFCCAYPHGASLEKIIHEGDLVVVDLGATYRFYRSDISRTFIAGKPTKEQSRIYETVKLAHQKAFETIKPNVPAKEVDLVAREVIHEAGFGDFFVHNLGHGVGLEVHETPILSPDSTDLLETGNVVTVEPGIYLPGFGGVRIEDTVLVTQDGAEKLTVAPYSLEATQ